MTDKINQLQLTRCNIDINNFVLRRRCDVDNIRRSGSSSSNNDSSSSNSNSSSSCNNNNNDNNSSDENCYVFNNYNASVSDTDNNDRCDGLELICSEFDWFDQLHLSRYQQLLYNNLRIIIACDVLYDKKLAMQLLHIISILAIPHQTVIFLAQKLRYNNDNDDNYDNNSGSNSSSCCDNGNNNDNNITSFDLKGVAELFHMINIKKVFIAYNVIIWTFMIDYH